MVLRLWEFFIPALADGFPLEFEWQQVSSTLLSILVDVNNAIVWMFSTCPLISKFSSPFINIWGDRSKSTNYNWYHCYLYVSLYFLVLYQGLDIYFSFRYLLILLFGLPGQQSQLFGRLFFFFFFFFFFFLTITRSGCLAEIIYY